MKTQSRLRGLVRGASPRPRRPPAPRRGTAPGHLPQRTSAPVTRLPRTSRTTGKRRTPKPASTRPNRSLKTSVGGSRILTSARPPCRQLITFRLPLTTRAHSQISRWIQAEEAHRADGTREQASPPTQPEDLRRLPGPAGRSHQGGRPPRLQPRRHHLRIKHIPRPCAPRPGHPADVRRC